MRNTFKPDYGLGILISLPFIFVVSVVLLCLFIKYMDFVLLGMAALLMGVFLVGAYMHYKLIEFKSHSMVMHRYLGGMRIIRYNDIRHIGLNYILVGKKKAAIFANMKNDGELLVRLQEQELPNLLDDNVRCAMLNDEIREGKAAASGIWISLPLSFIALLIVSSYYPRIDSNLLFFIIFMPIYYLSYKLRMKWLSRTVYVEVEN